MFTLKGFVTTFVILNTITAVIFISTSGIFNKEEQILSESIESKRFLNKKLALKVLEKLDIQDEPPLHSYNMIDPPRTNFNGVYLGLKRDPDYCAKVRKHFVENTEMYFTELTFISDLYHKSLTRAKVFPALGTDLMPKFGHEFMTKEEKLVPKTYLDIRAMIYYMNHNVHHEHILGKEIGCLYQAYNHVLGIGTLTRKDRVARSAINYTEKWKNKPQCFDGKKFFPQSRELQNKTECLQWFEYIDTEEYRKAKEEKTIVFIRKIGSGSHQGKGVQPVDEQEEKRLREVYQNGSRCGQNRDSVLIQHYIDNPLLVEGHKFDFRIYMMIASTNPLIVFYHDGFLRVSLFEYNVTSTEKGMHLTNTAQSIKAMEKAIADGVMNETELLNFQMWNLTRFTDYLIKMGKVESRAWLDEYLRPSFQHAMQHLIRMAQHTFQPYSMSWELYGMDFMLDENLNLWFIEANCGPVLKGTNPEKEQLVGKMLRDMYEIIASYLRSRLKRVIKYINWLEKKGLIKDSKFGDPVISKQDQRMVEFDDINRNYLDEEFELSSDNGWVKIIDENIEGLGRYNGMFALECFD